MYYEIRGAIKNRMASPRLSVLKAGCGFVLEFPQQSLPLAIPGIKVRLIDSIA